MGSRDALIANSLIAAPKMTLENNRKKNLAALFGKILLI